jgi:Tfp pilus assembly protein PilW
MLFFKYLIKNRYAKEDGFTLVELLLYAALSALFLTALSIFFALLLESRAKDEAISEVDQQGLQILQIVRQTVRNAEAINSPAPGVSGSTLSLDVLASPNDPTIFNESSGIFTIAEGAGSPIALNNNRVTISNLLFQNLSRPSTPGTVRIQFTLSYQNPSNRNEFRYQKTFFGGTTLRQP